jgi:hypothetical protein
MQQWKRFVGNSIELVARAVSAESILFGYMLEYRCKDIPATTS